MSKGSSDTTALLKAIDDYISDDTSFQHMQSISQLLNQLSTIPSNVVEKLCDNLSHYYAGKIKRALDLVEYLTYHSTAKLAEIVVEEKFVEALLYTLSVEDIQDITLNVLKLWTEKYSDKKQDMRPLFDFIENLENFDIYLPLLYTPTNEGITSEGSANQNNSNYGKSSGPLNSSPSPDEIDSLLESAATIRERSQNLLEDQAFDIMPDTYQKTTIEILLSEHKKLAESFQGINISEQPGDTREMIETVFSELNKFSKKLREKVAQIDRDDDSFGPEDNNNDYKITISNDNLSRRMDIELLNTMMDVEDFMTYKVEPCPRSVHCSHSDFLDDLPEQIRNNQEMGCPFWHSDRDKRRSVLADSGEIVYANVLCKGVKAANGCSADEQCTFSHNFFEHLFHPFNYKRAECSKASACCPNGKYCPYYHSETEKAAWIAVLKQHFSAVYTEDEQDDNQDLQEVNQEEEGPSKHERNKNSGSKVLSRYPLISDETGITRLADNLDYYNQFDEKEVKSGELNGKLHAKLLIRKRYNDPRELTRHFQNNCFYGVPLLANPYANYPPSVPQGSDQVNVENLKAE